MVAAGWRVVEYQSGIGHTVDRGRVDAHLSVDRRCRATVAHCRA